MATWNINVEAVEGPATSTTGNIPQWADTSGDTLATGLATSEGGNESADGGKVVLFKTSGQIHGSCGLVAGVYGTSSGAGDGVKGESAAGIGGYFIGNSSDGAIRVDQETTGHDIASFSNTADGSAMVIGADGTLTWSDAAGSAGTTANLDAMVGDSGSGGTKGLVPAPAAGDAAAGKFLKADGTWEAVPGGSGGDAWGDAVDADIVPDADGTRDLGSSANRFAELHVDQIDLNGTTINSLEDGADVTDATNVAAAGALMTADAGALATLDTVDTAQIDTDAIQAAQIRNGAVEFAKIAPAAVVTEADTIAANDNDTTLPTSAAVKDYADKAVEYASGVVDQIDFESVEPGDDTITLRLYAHYAFTINELRIKTASGTCTVAVKIDGTDVTGISAVAVSSTEATGTATAANSVSVGQTVTLVISDSSSVANLVGSLKFTR